VILHAAEDIDEGVERVDPAHLAVLMDSKK